MTTPNNPNNPKNPKVPNFPNYKLIKQMNGAARSNSQNVAEGFTSESLKSYIYLSGIARGSNEELGKNFEDFLRQRNLLIWDKNHPKVREFKAFRVVWKSLNSLNSPITLIYLTHYYIIPYLNTYYHIVNSGLNQNSLDTLYLIHNT